MEQKMVEALKWMVGIFEKHNILYQLSGGAEAHLYGANRPIYDLDFDIPEESFDVIIDDIKSFCF